MHRVVRRVAAVAGLGVGLLAVAACGADPAARVNGEVITQVEHQAAVRATGDYQALSRPAALADPRAQGALAQLRMQVLDGLIDERLLRQQAKVKGVVVGERDIDERIAGFITEVGGRDQFMQLLQENGLSAGRLRQVIGQGLLAERLLASEVPTPTGEVESRRVRHILVPTAEAAAAARARLVGGETWEKVAAEVSADPGSKARGGDLGFISRGQTVPPFEDSAFALPLNEVSQPVRSDFGFHIIQPIESRRQAPDAAQLQRARQVAYTQYVRSLQQQATIERTDAAARPAPVAVPPAQPPAAPTQPQPPAPPKP